MLEMETDKLKRLLMLLIWTAGAYFGSWMILAMLWGILVGIAFGISHQVHYDLRGYLTGHQTEMVMVGGFFRVFSVLLAVAAFILALRGRLPGTRHADHTSPLRETGIHGLFGRAIFTILWAIAFFFATLLVGTAVLPIICKIEGWGFPPRVPLSVAIAWTAIWFASPLVALSLGSRGLLPGTKKKSFQGH